MCGRRAHVNSPFRSGLPVRNLLSICYSLIEDIDRAAPDMEVMEPLVLPTSPGEDISRTQSCGRIGDVVVEIDSILNCHWPQRGFCLVRPIDGSMEHHGMCNLHDGPDASFCHTIVMMGTNSSKLDDLFELREVMSKGLGGKANTIVCDTGLGYNTMVSTELFILFFGLKSLMAVQAGLEGYMNIP